MEHKRITKKVSFARYALTSSFTAIIDYIILVSLVEFFSVYYLISATIAFIISHIINYFISRKWCFKGTQTHIIKGYFRFVTVGTISIVMTLTLLGIFVEQLHIRYFLARIIIYFITGIINFILNHFYTFKMNNIKN